VDYHRARKWAGVARVGSADDPAYSPERVGERAQLRHLAGRLRRVAAAPAGTLEAANRFLRDDYIAEFIAVFRSHQAAGNAFVPCRSRDWNGFLAAV